MPALKPAPSAPGSPDERRRCTISIHASAHKLGMDTADKSPHSDYRAMLQSIGGTASTKTMDLGGLRRVQKHLLQTLNAKSQKPKDGWHAEKMRQLWAELANLGALRDPSEEGLRLFVQKQTGLAALRFLSSGEGNRVVEALKSWVKRVSKKAE